MSRQRKPPGRSVRHGRRRRNFRRRVRGRMSRQRKPAGRPGGPGGGGGGWGWGWGGGGGGGAGPPPGGQPELQGPPEPLPHRAARGHLRGPLRARDRRA